MLHRIQLKLLCRLFFLLRTQVGNLVFYGIKLLLKSHSTAVSQNMPSLSFYHSPNIFMIYFIKLSICKKIRVRIQKNILPHCVILVSTLMERFIRRKYLSFCGSKDRRGKAKTTLVCRIDVHTRLLILRKKFPLYDLIWDCTFIDFEKNFPPAHLF